MSFRNNMDRMGPNPGEGGDLPIPPTMESPDPEQTQQPFSFSVPTEFVELPSKGKYYPENHPLHNKESVEIRFMTAKEEDILTSKTLLKKGLTIERLLRNVLVDKRIKPEEMLVGDRNNLIVATRITGYGELYETKVTCPVCAHVNKTSFDLSEVAIADQDISELDGVSKTDEGTFNIELPTSKAKVEVRPMNGKDEAKIAKLAERKKKQGLGETGLTDQFRTFIVSVNDDASTTTIHSFINNMPASDSRYLRTTYVKCVPNINMDQYFECESCTFGGNMEVPFTTDFFWPK